MNVRGISKKSLIILIGLLFFGFLARLNRTLSANYIFDLDSSRDIYMAREIAINGSRNIPDSECAGCSTIGGDMLKNSNFYFYFLALPYFLFQSPVGIALFNIMNGLCFCLFVFLITRQVFDTRTAFFSLIIAVSSDFLLNYSTRTNQSYYIATFSVIIIWLLLKNKFPALFLALILSFISTMVHFSSIPILIVVFYKIALNVKKITTLQMMSLILTIVFFLVIFIRFYTNFDNLGLHSNNLVSIIEKYSILNIVNNIHDVYANILHEKYFGYLIFLFAIVNIRKFKVLYPLILTFSVTGFVRINEYSGYYSVYYLVFLMVIGLSVNFVYVKNKYIAGVLLIIFLLRCHVQFYFYNLNFYSINNYLNNQHQRDVIEEINKINPQRMPVSASFRTTEYVFPFYYDANRRDLNDYLEIKETIARQRFDEGIMVCDDIKDGVCPYIEFAKGYKTFRLLSTIDHFPFYHWKKIR